MGTRVRSYAKVNLGLRIGPVRQDGFHGLVTLYQTIALHDQVTVSARRVSVDSTRIRLTSNHPWVPCDARNTAWKMVERALTHMGIGAEVAIHIEKRLPVRGGLGAGSANAAAALIALERELGLSLPKPDRLPAAAEVGSDVPLFLLGGAVLGTGRGEVVSPMPDFPPMPCVVAVPELGVSTPQAFRDWDARVAARRAERDRLHLSPEPDTLSELSGVYASIFGPVAEGSDARHDTSGTVRKPGRDSMLSRHPSKKWDDPEETQGRQASGLAENPLLALVRTGIENDFEEVVFSQNPSLREIKRDLLGTETDQPALYAALSGSGSALFGLYGSAAEAQAAQQRVQRSGVQALLTETLPRAELWKRMFAE